MSTRADEPSGITYTATQSRAGRLCDWCDESAAVIVAGYSDGYLALRERMCREHFAEYHPTLTVTL